MTTYFVDLIRGSDIKGDGQTATTAFKTFKHAEDVSFFKSLGITKTQLLEDLDGDTGELLTAFFGAHN